MCIASCCAATWSNGGCAGPGARLDEIPEPAGGDAADHRIGEHDELLEALRELPKGQRAVIVLRYFSDLSVEQTAEVLQRWAGNVKSRCSRGLATRRLLLGAESRIVTVLLSRP